MKGYDHYKKAERLLGRSNNSGMRWEERNNMVAQAKVHAILAQAASNMQGTLPFDDEERKGWDDAFNQG